MKRLFHFISLLVVFSLLSNKIEAQNPIISHCYTADPAPVVFPDNDSLYVYIDEDMNVSGVNDFYYMERWRVYSTVDMVNWTDHGVALPRTAFSWGREGTCWASQCIARDGKYYWYICISKPNDWRHYIGVARSDKPSGPFKDARKQPLISTGEGGDIDPTVFIDDDGQAYLYWGNNKLCYCYLSKSMLSVLTSKGGKNGIFEVPLTKEAFGGVKVNDKVQGADCYEEGPWLDKRGDKYYLMYAAGGVPEHISYSMSDSPTGPWKYKGKVMDDGSTGSFTNHSGMVHYKGKDYFFYHTGWAKGGGGFNRSVAVEEMFFNEDGTIKPIKATRKGVKALCTTNPYIRQQAETLNAGMGIKVVGNEDKGVYVTDTHANDSMRVANIDFGEKGAESITIRMASIANSGYIYLRQDGAKGKILAKINIESTGAEDAWEERTFDLTTIPKGVHAIHFSFYGSKTNNICNLDWWKFNEVGTKASSIEVVNSKVNDGKYYDLTGRVVDNPTNGIYIFNGKKIKK